MEEARGGLCSAVVVNVTWAVPGAAAASAALFASFLNTRKLTSRTATGLVQSSASIQKGMQYGPVFSTSQYMTPWCCVSMVLRF